MVLGAAFSVIPQLARVLPSAIAIGTRTAKFANKNKFTRAGTTSAIFGLGYGASTNIGYNAANLGVTSYFRRNQTPSYTSKFTRSSMPYGRYSSRRSYSRYPRYSTRRPYRRYRSRPYRRSYY